MGTRFGELDHAHTLTTNMYDKWSLVGRAQTVLKYTECL